MSRKNWLNTFKRITLLSACLCLTFAFSACSGSPKKENDIAEEIASIDSYFRNYDLEITNFTITKRQTNRDDKNDLIWITLTGSNEEFIYTANYSAVYILYNDGWYLEKYSIEGYNYAALMGPTSEEIKSNLSKDYFNVEIVSQDGISTQNYKSYVLHGNIEENLITKTFEIRVHYVFSPDNQS